MNPRRTVFVGEGGYTRNLAGGRDARKALYTIYDDGSKDSNARDTHVLYLTGLTARETKDFD